MKRIIVEGPDGSGKTRLIQDITGYFDTSTIPIVGFKNQSVTQNYTAWLAKVLETDFGRVPVHDRLFYSELVYAPILRPDRPTVSATLTKQILTGLREEAFLIYCHIPYALLVKTATENPQMEGVMHKLYSIYHAYQALMLEEYPHYFKHRHYFGYDFTRPSAWSELTMQLKLYLAGVL